MRKRIITIILALFLQLALVSTVCAGGSEPPDPLWNGYKVGDPMTAEQEAALFKDYKTIGDSLTAGCQGLNLQADLQRFSYPAQLAASMKSVSPDLEFYQPLVNYPGVGIPNPDDWCRGDRSSPLTTMLFHTREDWTFFNWFSDQDKMDNMAITGATLSQVLDNDAFAVFNSSTSFVNDMVGMFSPFAYSALGGIPKLTTSAVDQVLENNPSFLTVWIGNNDVVFATALCDPGVCTDTAFWQEKWNELVRRIKATSSIRGVLAITLPDSTKCPLLQDPGNPFHTVAEGLVLPPGSKVPFFSTHTGPGDPIMTAAEMETIKAKTQAINNIIAATCKAENWAMVDAWKELNTGIETGWTLRYADGTPSDVTLTADFPTGGIFSYNGMHPTSPAYAYMANKAVDAINTHYKTHLPYVDAHAVLLQDRLCQDPIDPRNEQEMCELISNMYNMFAPVF